MDDTFLNLVRVSGTGESHAMVGNILIITKHSEEDATEFFSIRAVPLLSGMQTAMLDKFTINRIEAIVNHNDKTIAIGPHQGVEFEASLRNRGLGSYIFNKLVAALCKVAADYTFVPYKADIDSLESPKALEAFLEHFGIQIEYSPDLKLYNLLIPSPAEITAYYNQQKITELELENYIYELVNNQQSFKPQKTDSQLLPEEQFDKYADTIIGLNPNILVRITVGICIVLIMIIFYIIK